MKPIIYFVLVFSGSVFAFDWQGHRGARGLYPENTIKGMQLAAQYPITTLEMDVVISKDQQVIVSHEPWMNSEICLDGGGGPLGDKGTSIYQLTYEEILKFDCGSKPHPRFPEQLKEKASKPLLRDLISTMEKEFKKSGKKLNYSIEIKSSPEQEARGLQPDFKSFTDLVLQTILSQLPRERFMLQSFDWRVLKYLHHKDPNVQLVALRETAYTVKVLEDELGFFPTVFSPEWVYLTAEQVDYFHSKKIKVIPWTVNQIEDMKKMLGLRVDGMITDYPNLIKSIPAEFYLTKLSPCLPRESFFEGRCVKIPKHAIPSETNPGWVCKSGYQQKRNSCVKIKTPDHSHLLEDGKTWVCNSGYERYRHRCRKIR